MADTWRNPVDEYTARLEAVRQAETEFAAALQEVQRYAPDFLREIDLPLLEGLLPDDRTALVSFCLTEMGSLGFVLTRGGPEPPLQMVDVPGFTTEDLNALLFGPGPAATASNGWVAAAQRVGDGGAAARDDWQTVFDQVLEAVGSRLVRPILAAIPERARRLILLPSGGLYLLPLHAVPLDGSTVRVCDRFVVSYGPSAAILALLQQKARPSAAPTIYAAAVADAPRPQTGPLPQMPFAEYEARTVAGLFPDAAVDLGPAATVGSACRRAVGRAYGHFVCHGRYEENDPPKSGLELTDGRLQLTDLLDGRLDLSAARLVTLSACEAGLTDVTRGSAEEYVGLPAGFLIAGVPCVLSSLWAVDDLAGTMLIERFYRHHLQDGMDFPQALHEAQSWLRWLPAAEVAAYAERAYRVASPPDRPLLLRAWRNCKSMAAKAPDARPLAHPHYWAVFTVNGW